MMALILLLTYAKGEQHVTNLQLRKICIELELLVWF